MSTPAAWVRISCITPFFLILSLSQSASATPGVCDTAGPVEIEATAAVTTPTAYSTLQLGFAAVNSGVHQGTVTVDICGNTTETVTAVLIGSGQGSASYTTVNVAPVGGARTISGSIAGGPIIDLNSGDNTTIDGQAGNLLTVTNSSTSGLGGTGAVRFINDATGNTVNRVNLQGSGTGGGSGVVVFGTTSLAVTGNDGNVISNCSIGPAGANTPEIGVLSLGTNANAGAHNSFNTISNNNIFDIFDAGTPVAIALVAGSDSFVVQNNHIFQTAPITVTQNITVYGIVADVATGSGFTITGNFIGGSAPFAMGAPWTQTGSPTTVSHTMTGIRVDTVDSVANVINGNTIRNIDLTTNNGGEAQAALSVGDGSHNIGTNTIGSQDSTGSIVVTNSFNGSYVGIRSAVGGPGGAVNIVGNTIGGITQQGTGSPEFRGIRIDSSPARPGGILIANNVIGSPTIPSSIQSASNAPMHGISSANPNPATITGNTIANLSVTNAGTSAAFHGINVTIGTININGHIITGNTIRDILSSGISSTDASQVTPLVGTFFSPSVSSGHDISGNTIRNLVSDAPTQAVKVRGLLHTGAATSGTITRNLISNLTVASTSTAADVTGINLFTGSWDVSNNMIALGSGISSSLNPQVNGIDASGLNTTQNVWFNSVVIDGVQGGASVTSACFRETNATAVDLKSNIFWNNRASTGSPGGGTGRHYAIFKGSVATTLTSDFNDLFAPNNGGTVGRINSADQVTLANWQTASGQDASSLNVNPLVVDGTSNLHLQLGSPMIDVGTAAGGIVIDFDGQNRPNGGFDIGADEFYQPTAAGVSLGGRVVDSLGRAVSRAVVSVYGGDLKGSLVAVTGRHGRYTFYDLDPGLTYFVSVKAVRFRYSETRVVNLFDSVTNFDFVVTRSSGLGTSVIGTSRTRMS